MIPFTTQMRLTRTWRVGNTLPVVWSVALAALMAGCAEFHAVFGTLLCTLVLLQFARQMRASNAGAGTQPYEFARHLSRLIYLLLYSVLLLKVLAAIGSASWQYDGLSFGWSSHFQANPEQLFIECGERFRLDLLWGVIALCLIRVLSAYQLRAASSEAAPIPLRTNSPLQPPRPAARS